MYSPDHFHTYGSVAQGHVVCYQPHHPALELFSSCETDILDQLHSASHCPLPSAPGNQHSPFRSRDVDCAKYRILVESCSISLFVTGLLSSAFNILQVHLCCQCTAGFPSCLKLSNIPLCGYTTFCLSIHLLKDTWLASTLWRL